MEYKFEENRIYAEDKNGVLLAEITFPETERGVFTINRTFTAESLRGQGIAAELVGLAVKRIKECGGRVEATCSYAKRVLEKNKSEG